MIISHIQKIELIGKRERREKLAFSFGELKDHNIKAERVIGGPSIHGGRSDTMSENEKIILAIIVIAYIYSRMD